MKGAAFERNGFHGSSIGAAILDFLRALDEAQPAASMDDWLVRFWVGMTGPSMSR